MPITILSKHIVIYPVRLFCNAVFLDFHY